jgi:hypothetical protein
MSKVTVKPSGADRRVPIERRGKPSYFPQDAATTVELTQYIQRRIDCGDLVEVPPAKPEAAPKPAPTPPAPPATKAEG